MGIEITRYICFFNRLHCSSLVSGDRVENVVGGFPPSGSTMVLVKKLCWRRISSPHNVLLRQARSAVGDGFRTLRP